LLDDTWLQLEQNMYSVDIFLSPELLFISFKVFNLHTNVGVYIIWQMVRYSSLDTRKTTEIGDEIFKHGTSRIFDIAAANVVIFLYAKHLCIVLHTHLSYVRLDTLAAFKHLFSHLSWPASASACCRVVLHETPCLARSSFRSPSRPNATYRTDLFIRTDSIRLSIAQCECVRVFPPAIPSVRPSVLPFVRPVCLT